MNWTGDDDSLITAEMLGLLLVGVVDVLLLVGVLWTFGHVSTSLAATISAVVVGVFLAWILKRWFTLNAAGSDDPDPVETLKRRYANDELSEAAFERKLDALLDADERTEDTDYYANEPISERSSERRV